MPAARRPHAGASAARPKPATPSAGKVPKFLRSLYAILQTEDRAIVAWVQNQELAPNRLTAFHILDMARFEREILPKYFKHQKFASFQRQLNNFGFRKWTKTQSSGVCTFSHNCFPPDPARAGVMRASMREQWRQLPPEGDVGADGRPRRRIVGNGITKAKRAAARAEAAAQVDAMATPNAQFKSAATAMGDVFAGLEAFCDGAQVTPIPHQAFLLPPLQPHHLVTPRGSLYAPTIMPPDMEAAPAGSFRQSLVAAMAAKPPLYQPEAVDVAAPHGAFLEPWMWDVHHAGMDLGALPLDADWQENGGSNGSGGVHGQAVIAPAGMGTRDGPCHSQDRAVPSGVEDFGLENLLFVE